MQVSISIILLLINIYIYQSTHFTYLPICISRVCKKNVCGQCSSLEAPHFKTDTGLLVRVDENSTVTSQTEQAPTQDKTIHDAQSVAIANSAARRRVCRGCKDFLVKQAKERIESKLHRSSSGSSKGAGKSDSESSVTSAVDGENSPNGSPAVHASSKSIGTGITPLQERSTTAKTTTNKKEHSIDTNGHTVRQIATPASNGSFERIWDDDLSTHYTSMSEQLTSPLVHSTMRTALDAEGESAILSATPASPRSHHSPFADMSSILFGIPLLEEDDEDGDEYDDEDDTDSVDLPPINLISPNAIDSNTHFALNDEHTEEGFEVDTMNTESNEDGIATPVRTRTHRPLAADSGKDSHTFSTATAGVNDQPTRGSVYTSKAPKLVVSGAPGAGKTTQCEVLRQELGVIHLSVGEILRQAMSEANESDLQASSYVENWKLSDEFVTRVVCDRLKQPDCQSKGWLLDDFPRTKVQAAALSFAGVNPDCFVMLEVTEDSLVDRVKGRRVDPVTGNIYHDKFNPPKSKIVASRLTQRCDDAEVTFAKRFCDFMTHKDGLQSWYSEKALVVDASAAPFSVAHQILTAIDGDLFTNTNTNTSETEIVTETYSNSKHSSPTSPTLFPSLQDLYMKSAEKKDSPNSAVATTPNPMMSRSRAPPVSYISSPNTDIDKDGDGDRSSLFAYSPDMSISGFDSARHVYLSPMMADSPCASSVMNTSDEFQSPLSTYSGASVKSFRSSVAVRARIAALTEQQSFSIVRFISSWTTYIARFPLLAVALKTIAISLLLQIMGNIVELRNRHSSQQRNHANNNKQYGMDRRPSFMQYALLPYSGGNSGAPQPGLESDSFSTVTDWGGDKQNSITRTYFVAITARKCLASSTTSCTSTNRWTHKNVYVRMVHDTADNLYSHFVQVLLELNGSIHDHKDYF